MNWLTLLLIIGATARLTRLVTHDTITAPLRRFLATVDARRHHRRTQRALAAAHIATLTGDGAPADDAAAPMTNTTSPTNPAAPGPLYSFATCPWCVSVWVSAGMVYASWNIPPQWANVLAAVYAALTASHVASVVIGKETAAR